MTSNTNHSTIPGSILHKNRIFLKHFDWPKLKKRINKQLERNEKWIAKLNEKKATSIKNSKYIPGNATINQEYVKCGKRDCPWCEHGPYYYAYWKENGKLRKRYIGEYPPSIQKTTKDNDHASSDTVADTSDTLEPV